MSKCVHERLCSEYLRRYGKIISKHCPNPNRCPFFKKENYVSIKEFADSVADAFASEFDIDDDNVVHMKRKTVPRDMVDDCYGV